MGMILYYFVIKIVISDHDHYTEPYIAVKQEIRTAFPLSQLRHIFDKSGMGREATEEDKKIV